MRKRDFVGTGILLRLAARRDRVRLPLWLLGIAALAASLVHSYAEFSASEMQSMVIMASENPGMRLLVAPVSAASVSEPGAFLLFRSSFLFAILFGLMTIGIVIRHTRHNEESGCAELLGSTVVGRFAKLAAALTLAFGANLLLVLLIVAALAGGGMPVSGSIATGASLGAFGLVMTGVTAIAVQLSDSSRGANGLGLLALAGGFVINSLGNVMGEVHQQGLGFASGWLSWLSPLGWTQQVKAFDQNHWPVLFLPLIATVFLASCAFKLVTVRDVGRGILAARPGPASAPPSLLSPVGLAWRLQKGTLLGWAIPVLLIALLFGAASQAYGDTIEDIELFERLAASSEHFRFMLIGVVALLVSIFTTQSLLRKRSEEDGGPLEAVLATAVSRPQWMLSHMICAFVGSAVLLILFGLGVSLSSGASGSETVDFLQSSLLHIAPIITIGGFVVAAYGLFPRLARAIAALVVLVALLAGPFFGPLLGLPAALMNISPFTHVPLAPADASFAAIAILLATGLILAAVGVEAFNRRNLSL